MPSKLVRTNAIRSHRHRHETVQHVMTSSHSQQHSSSNNSCRQSSCRNSTDAHANNATARTAVSLESPIGRIRVLIAEVVAATRSLLANGRSDPLLVRIAGALLLLVAAISLIVSLALGIVVLLGFVAGFAIAVHLLQRRELVFEWLARRWQLDTLLSAIRLLPTEDAYEDDNEADANDAPISADTLAMQPWKAIRIDSHLDKAIDSFFSRILNTFIDSWYGDITADEQFVLAIRQHLREALSRLILLVRCVDIPALITDRLLPVCFGHFEVLDAMLAARPNAHDRLAHDFHAGQQHSVHPAVRNRRAERNYLRALAAFLVPRLCPNAERGQALESRVFGSLLRELFAQWALLPLMDVLADPDLINLLVLIASNRSTRPLGALSIEGRVEFLGRFVRPHRRAKRAASVRPAVAGSSDLLTDQTQMYSFMQYLKREGAVDVLRFFLDVDALNADLLDPKVTTDPAKLSALQQQSEKLLAAYRQMQCDAGHSEPVRTLAEAHEAVRAELLGRWQSGFRGTVEYFRIVYGDREAREADDVAEPGGCRRSLKTKCTRSAVETAEDASSVWDAFADDSPGAGGAQTIGAGSGRRKERHHRLDAIVGKFMQSIEHIAELGVEAASGDDETTRLLRSRSNRKRTPPGRNPTFADLFQIGEQGPKIVDDSISRDDRNQGPVGCLIFILVRILHAPQIVVRMVLAIVAICRDLVERCVRHLIESVLRVGVYEPRLTLLITTLENHLFDGKKDETPGLDELRERRRQARQRLANIHGQLPRLLDALQTPTLNKQLMYTLLDVVLVKLWPELDTTGTPSPTTTKRTPHHHPI